MTDTTEVWGSVMAAVSASGGCVDCAALSEPAVFRDYFYKHLSNASFHAGRQVQPLGVGTDGAYMLGLLGVGGYGYSDSLHSSVWLGDPQDPAGEVMVVGLDQSRIDLGVSVAEAAGLRVVYTVRMSDNEVSYL